MRDKVFVLCVGCQKGATSWLHEQLSKSNQVDLGFAKEYQVLDTLYIPDFMGLHNAKVARLKKILEKNIELKQRHSGLLQNINFVLDVKSYYDYFDNLWQKNENITTVGDFTPHYAALPVSAFKEVKSQLEQRGFRVKVVFIMRDPVERCWSMVRMRRRNIMKRSPEKNLIPEAQDLENSYTNRPCELFTRYEQSIQNLEEVFDKSELHFAIYENLFNKESLDNLEKFFQIPDFKPNIEKKVNVSKKSASDLPDSLVGEITEYYRATYEYCDERFNTSGMWKTTKAA